MTSLRNATRDANGIVAVEVGLEDDADTVLRWVVYPDGRWALRRSQDDGCGTRAEFGIASAVDPA